MTMFIGPYTLQLFSKFPSLYEASFETEGQNRFHHAGSSTIQPLLLTRRMISLITAT